MRKIISIAILATVVLSSCSYEKKCVKWTKRCKPDSTYIYKTDTIRDTTIVVEFFNDTVWLKKYIKIPKYVKGKTPMINLDTMTKEVGVIGLQMWINNNVMGSNAYLTDSTILVKTKVYRWRNIRHSNRLIYVKENTSFANFTEWFFWIIAAIALVYLVLKYIKRWLSL